MDQEACVAQLEREHADEIEFEEEYGKQQAEIEQRYMAEIEGT